MPMIGAAAWLFVVWYMVDPVLDGIFVLRAADPGSAAYILAFIKVAMMSLGAVFSLILIVRLARTPGPKTAPRRTALERPRETFDIEGPLCRRRARRVTDLPRWRRRVRRLVDRLCRTACGPRVTVGFVPVAAQATA